MGASSDSQAASTMNTYRSNLLVQALNRMGMPLYRMQPPTGYSWKAEAWVNSAALLNRMNFALALGAGRMQGVKFEPDAMLKGEWGEAHFNLTRWTPRTLDLKGTSAGIQVQNFARSFRFTTVPRSSLVVAADWEVHAAEQFDGSVMKSQTSCGRAETTMHSLRRIGQPITGKRRSAARPSRVSCMRRVTCS